MLSMAADVERWSRTEHCGHLRCDEAAQLIEHIASRSRLIHLIQLSIVHAIRIGGCCGFVLKGLAKIGCVSLLVAVGSTLCISVALAKSRTYEACINDALTELAKGNCQAGLDFVAEAITHNATDPLAHVTAGLALLMAGKPDDALIELSAATELGDVCPEAAYGKGLIFLSRGQIDMAKAFFEAAALGNGVSGAVVYANWLAGNREPIPSGSDDDCMRSLRALEIMRAGNAGAAAAEFEALANRPLGIMATETPGCLMTGLKERPVVFSGQTLKKPYKSFNTGKRNQPILSGRVLLKANTSKARSVYMVSFFVDNNLVAITNHAPWQYEWDTTRVANGPHTVRITGTDHLGVKTCEVSRRVLVHNKSKVARSSRDRGRDQLWAKLAELMKLRPSIAFLNYNLALCAFQRGDSIAGVTALERVLAVDPDYRDAAALLAGAYGANGNATSIRRIAVTSKRIALTFDDGPREYTTKLLDLLKERNVKATFFVLGKLAATHPDIIRRMSEDGHAVENHTYSHRDLEYLSTRDIVRELFSTCVVLRSLTGNRPVFLRPPGGHVGKRLPYVTDKFGLRTVLWTINCSSLEGTSPARMIDYVMSSLEPGAIILMHNLETVTLNALPQIIDGIRRKGYDFATLPELVGTARPTYASSPLPVKK